MVLLGSFGGCSRTLLEGSDSEMAASRKYATVNNFAGLVTAFGQLGAPPGSFSVADNVDIPNGKLLEKRRAVGRIGPDSVGVPASLVLAEPMSYPYGHIIGNYAADTAATAASYLYDVDTGIIPLPGALTAVNDFRTRMKGAIMRGNTYLTTQNGVVRLESDGVAWWAGAPFCAALGKYTTTVGPMAWLPAGSMVAYRAVLVQYDANDVPMRGKPSSVLYVKNSGTEPIFPTLFVLGKLYAANILDNVDTSNTRRIDIELYRSAASSQVPNDELQLCHRHTLTGTEKLGSAARFEDTCPEAALGAYLYTNAISGGDTVQNGFSVGLAARNAIPPIATDIAMFSNRAWYSGLSVPHELLFSIVAIGASGSALKSGDVITIAGKSVVVIVETSGSVAENLRDTAMRLITNWYGSPSLGCGVGLEYVGSLSSPGTAGLLRAYALTQSRAPFTVQITSGGSGGSFVPAIDLPVSSAAEDWKNGLAYSKENQPDAVPPVNYIRVGRGDVAIKRIIALRDSLFVFASDGVWRVTGNDPSNFNLERFDTTFTLLARDTAVVLDDAIYAWGSEGIARITTGGVVLIDGAIRDIVTQQRIADVSTAWAVADRLRKRVLFFLPNHSSNACALPVANRALVFHTTPGVWTRYDYGADSAKTCAAHLAASDPQQLVFGNADDGSGTVTAGTETDGPGYVRAGGVHSGRGIARERMTNAPSDWTDVSNGGVNVPITSTLRWSNATPDPQTSAQWQELHVFFAPNDNISILGAPSALTLGFKTEMTTSEQAVSWAQPAPPAAISSQARLMVPRDASRGARMFVRLTHAVPSEYFSVDGFGLLYEPTGHEVSR
jgi:hypothetical protein